MDKVHAPALMAYVLVCMLGTALFVANNDTSLGKAIAAPSSSTGGSTLVAPIMPTNVRIVSVNPSLSTVSIAWSPADDGPFSGYYVYRNGKSIATVTSTSFTNTGLVPNNYFYQVATFYKTSAGTKVSSLSSKVYAYMNCTETDGGANYYAKGTTTQGVSNNDTCGTSGGAAADGTPGCLYGSTTCASYCGVYPTDCGKCPSCIGGSASNNVLTEYYCDKPDTNGEMQSVQFTCPSGCFDGACVNTTSGAVPDGTPGCLYGSTICANYCGVYPADCGRCSSCIGK